MGDKNPLAATGGEPVKCGQKTCDLPAVGESRWVTGQVTAGCAEHLTAAVALGNMLGGHSIPVRRLGETQWRFPADVAAEFGDEAEG